MISPFSQHLSYRLAALAIASIGFSLPSQGALLIYEGFTGYNTSGYLKGQAVSANAVGLSGTWGGNAAADSAGTFIAAGLTFGSLETSGGAYRVGGGTVVVGAGATSSALTSTGTLWASQLVRFNGNQNNSSTGNGLEIRIGDDAGGATNSRYRTFPDSRLSGTTLVGVDYNTGNLDGISNAPEAALPINTTYLFISSFTNIGAAVGTTATATTWVLTLSQFQAMLDSTKTPEQYLTDADSSLYSAKATDTVDLVKASDGIKTGSHLQLVNVNDNVTIDEIRYGTTLGDVIPLIPEPSSALLSLLGSSILLRRRR